MLFKPNPPSGLRLLSTVNAASVATVDVDATFDSTYGFYLLVASGIRPATSLDTLHCRMKSGAAYLSTLYFGHADTSSSNSASYSGVNSNGATSLQISGAAGNASHEHVDFTMSIFNPSLATRFPSVSWFGGNSGNNLGVCSGSGVNGGVVGAISGLRFFFSSGNIASGSFRLFGLVNS